MEEKFNLDKEFTALADRLAAVEEEMRCAAGLMEVVCSGVESILREDDNYAYLSLCAVSNYVSALYKKDIKGLHDCMMKLKGAYDDEKDCQPNPV